MKLISVTRITNVVFAVSVIFAISGSVASAQIPEIELGGYAWSSNIGWISLNCATGGVGGASVCPGSAGPGPKSDYKVTIEEVTGNMTGYAWSSNIGWIRFGGLSGFPTATGNVAQNARVTGTYPNLTMQGWARACAGTDSSANSCDTMANNPDAGGWDGWISLRGTSPNYGVNINNFGSAQYVWGSTVVGWIDMSSRATEAAIRSNLDITAFARTGAAVESNGLVNNVQFSATVTGVPTGVSVPYRLVSGAATPVSGTFSNGTFSNGLTLNGLNFGTTQTATLYLDMPPAVALPGVLIEGIGSNPPEETAGNSRSIPFDLNPAPPVITLTSGTTNTDRVTIRQGETVTLNWSITAESNVSCVAQGNVASNPSITHNAALNNTSNGQFSTNALTSRSEITISCTGATGTTYTRTVFIDMIPGVQEI
jgi:hypothetical protein